MWVSFVCKTRWPSEWPLCRVEYHSFAPNVSHIISIIHLLLTFNTLLAKSQLKILVTNNSCDYFNTSL